MFALRPSALRVTLRSSSLCNAPECRVNGSALAVEGVGLGEEPEEELPLSAPLPQWIPPLKKLAPMGQGVAEAEEEAEAVQLRVRTALTPQPVFGSHVPWTMPLILYLCGLRSAKTQPFQKSLRSLGHLLLFNVQDCSLRRPQVRWRVQASRQRMMLLTQI